MNSKPSIKDWIIATRPWAFPASVVPAFVAFLYTLNMYSGAEVNWTLGIVAILGAMIFHSGGNLISDYFDYKKGVDREDVISVPTLVSRKFTPKQILIYGLSFIAIGVVIGLFLVKATGISLLWIGLVGFIGAMFYSQFKYKALGDLLIFIVYGPTIMLGVNYVMLGSIDWRILLVSFPIAFITVNILHSNNTRDMRSDRFANIKTQAMLIGIKASIYQYYILTIFAYLAIIAMVLLNILPIYALICLLTIPIAYRNCKAMAQITEDDMTPINDLDKGTAQLQLAFGGLLSIGLIVSCIL